MPWSTFLEKSFLSYSLKYPVGFIWMSFDQKMNMQIAATKSKDEPVWIKSGVWGKVQAGEAALDAAWMKT